MADKYIELNAFVKLKGFASTGGQAKLIIRSKHVKVNGAIETQNRKKLHVGDKVDIQGKEFVVEESVLKMG
ncbi:MAG: RNA-binding S4 domain-containing protein [Candidatus Nanoarchaeia archaeon]|nr:RNA-binding S4 domain-containing protein [Candidatus Nanoarchaeia archaeon]MDD5239089.1 RNA-binding S4 domain-containing protein [Candidatus Nanoarchaeia archaeon]